MIGSVLVKTKRRLPEDPKGKAPEKNLRRKSQGNEKDRLIWETLNRSIFKYCGANRNKIRTIQNWLCDNQSLTSLIAILGLHNIQELIHAFLNMRELIPNNYC